MQDWSAELPSGGTGKHRGWIGFGSDRDGGKYVENGWQNSWQSENSGGDSSWDGKQISDDGWDASGKHKWSWGNGGSHGWGTWGNSGKQGLTRHYGVDFGDDTSSSIGFGPESSYTSWGNTNTDSWKNSGGGEGWRKWKGWKSLTNFYVQLF